MTDAQKMKICKMLETLGEDITTIEDSCDSLRYFIKTINNFVNNSSSFAEWNLGIGLDGTSKFECNNCFGIFDVPYNYCPNCGVCHFRKEEENNETTFKKR